MSDDGEGKAADSEQVPVTSARPAPPVRHEGAVAIGATAVGALALGALAVGAMAIARLAIGRLAVGRARLRSGQVDELRIARLYHRGTAYRAYARKSIGSPGPAAARRRGRYGAGVTIGPCAGSTRTTDRRNGRR